MTFKSTFRSSLTATTILCLYAMTSSCTSSKSLYSWYKYDDAAYQNSKQQTEKTNEKFEQEITKVINKQTGSRATVPPGVFAEYGYWLYKNGKSEDGVEMLKKEIEVYPESTVYISRIIKQLEK